MKFALTIIFVYALMITAAITQPESTPVDRCNVCDLDRDGDCDAADYALFQECFDNGNPTPSPTPTASPTPTPTPVPTPTPTATPSPSPEPTVSPSPAPTPTPIPGIGSIDDIQSALDALPAGGTLTLAAGTYTWATTNYNDALTIDKPCTLRGNGTVIIDAGASYGTAQTGHRRGIWIRSDNVSIEDITVRRAHREGVLVGAVSGAILRGVIARECGLNPTNAESAGIKLNRSTSFLVENCAAFNCYAGIATKYATNGVIRHCWAQGCGKMADGRVLYAENADGITTSQATHGSEGVHITSCGVVDCGDDQIDLSHSRRCSVKHSFALAGNADRLANGDGNGFKVGNDANSDPTRNCRDLTIEDVYALSNAANGIDGRNCRGHTYIDCTAYGNQGQFSFSGGNDTSAPKTFSNIVAVGQTVPARDRAHVQRTDPGWAAPDRAIDARWQGSAEATYRYVWNQVKSNFEVTP